MSRINLKIYFKFGMGVKYKKRTERGLLIFETT